MRKITDHSVGAFLARKPMKSGNMEVRVEGTVGAESTSILLLHGNKIAKLYSDGSVDVTSAGGNTPTTKDRLNGIPGVSVTQKAGVWYLNGVEWDGDWQCVSEGYHVRQRGAEWEVTFPYFVARPPMKFPTEAAARVFVEVQQPNAA